MTQVAQRGQHIGRPTGGEDAATFLAKPKVLATQAALESGLSLRQVAAQAGVAVNTVRKVKGLLALKRE